MFSAHERTLEKTPDELRQMPSMFFFTEDTVEKSSNPRRFAELLSVSSEENFTDD
jgi:hypothetical protein